MLRDRISPDALNIQGKHEHFSDRGCIDDFMTNPLISALLVLLVSCCLCSLMYSFFGVKHAFFPSIHIGFMSFNPN